MKKNLVKITIILSMILLTLFPLSVSADRSGTCGDSLAWTYSNADDTLTISGTGYMDSWGSDYEVPWFTNRHLIKKVIIKDGVTSIGANAFIYCENLTSIEIPESVEKVGSHAFYQCISLKEITIPEKVTIINSYVFYNCTQLENINIPKKVKRIYNNAFYNTKNLKTITLPKSVASIERSAFQESGLSTLYFEGTRSEWNDVEKGSLAIPSSTVIHCATSLITYNANGGINAPSAIEKEVESTINISSEKPSRDGYKFLGWATSSSATVAEYQPNDTITIGTNDITLYAVWKLIPYTKTQSLNGIFLVTLTGVENGNRVIFVCYNGDKMVYVNPYIYAGETTIPFSTTETYDKVKVMVWENLETCVPLCEAEDVPLN